MTEFQYDVSMLHAYNAMEAYIEALEWERECWELQRINWNGGLRITGWHELRDLFHSAQAASAAARENLVNMGVLK